MSHGDLPNGHGSNAETEHIHNRLGEHEEQLAALRTGQQEANAIGRETNHRTFKMAEHLHDIREEQKAQRAMLEELLRRTAA